MFSRISILSLAAAALLSVSVSAAPAPATQHLTARDFNCDVENVQCCKSTMTHKEAQKEFGGLLALDGLIGNIGLNCSPLGISALSSCKSTPVCCSQVNQNGLVNAGCSPLSVA